MRALRSSVLALISLLALPALARAQVECPGAATDCVDVPTTFEATLGRGNGLGFDTDWFPSGSPVQLRAVVRVDGTTRVRLVGDASARWPEAITVAVAGRPDAGTFAIDYGITIELRVRFGVTVLGKYIGGDYAIPIPFIPSDLAFVANRPLSDFVFESDGEPASLTDSIAPITIVKYDALQAILPVPGLSGAIILDAQGSLSSSYRTDHLLVSNGTEIATMDATVLASPELPPDYGAELALGFTPEGRVEQQFTITLRPRLHLSFFDVVSYDVDILSLPIPLPARERAIVFPETLVAFALPDLEPLPSKVTFATVDVGGSSTRLLEFRNTGLRTLTVDVDQLPTGYATNTAQLTVPPSSTARMLVTHRPTEPGSTLSTFVLLTNDPDQPEVRIGLEATATGPVVPEPMADGGVGLGDGGYVGAQAGGGCSCDVAHGSAPGALSSAFAAAFGLLALSRSRRRARA